MLYGNARLVSCHFVSSSLEHDMDSFGNNVVGIIEVFELVFLGLLQQLNQSRSCMALVIHCAVFWTIIYELPVSLKSNKYIIQ